MWKYPRSKEGYLLYPSYPTCLINLALVKAQPSKYAIVFSRSPSTLKIFNPIVLGLIWLELPQLKGVEHLSWICCAKFYPSLECFGWICVKKGPSARKATEWGLCQARLFLAGSGPTED